jgi:hypothetical protein
MRRASLRAFHEDLEAGGSILRKEKGTYLGSVRKILGEDMERRPQRPLSQSPEPT